MSDRSGDLRTKAPAAAWSESALSEEAREQLAALMDQYLTSLEQGQPLDVDALCAEHPQLAAGIRHYLESLDFIHGAAAGLRAPQSDDATLSPTPPGQLGNYRLLREIGRGGMGVVYEAEDVLLNRRVAVKLLPFAALLDQKQIVRFQNEARAAGQLHHPHIVPVHAVGIDQGIHYFAMQYIAGQSLRTLLDSMAPATATPNSTELYNRQPQPNTAPSPAVISTASPVAVSTVSVQQRDRIRSAARLAIDVAEALDHAHAHGVIHRDIKPANLLLDEAGKVWVTDFGLARAPQETGVTLSGDVMGTIRYMSPEQAAGRTAYVDHRTDVYSLGITLYELLTLRPAFPTQNRQAFLRMIEHTEPTPPRQLNRNIPADLENVVLKAIAKEPAARYATAQEFADDLRRFLEGKPTQAKRPTLLDRAAKWTHRHSRLVAATLMVMALMLMGTLTATLIIATEQNRTAQALHEFRRLFEQSNGAFDQHLLLNERLAAIPGAEPVRRDMLRAAREHWENVISIAGEVEPGTPRLKTGPRRRLHEGGRGGQVAGRPARGPPAL